VGVSSRRRRVEIETKIENVIEMDMIVAIDTGGEVGVGKETGAVLAASLARAG